MRRDDRLLRVPGKAAPRRFPAGANARLRRRGAPRAIRAPSCRAPPSPSAPSRWSGDCCAPSRRSPRSAGRIRRTIVPGSPLPDRSRWRRCKEEQGCGCPSHGGEYRPARRPPRPAASPAAAPLTSSPLADDKSSREAAVDILTQWLDVGVLRAKGLSLGGSILAAALILFLGRLAARVVAGALSRVLQRSHTDATLVKFLYNLVYALLMVFIVVAALEKVGVNTTSFIGIVAAAGLAIGLALQGSLSNFAAGVVIILLRHFGVGDRIEAAGP